MPEDFEPLLEADEDDDDDDGFATKDGRLKMSKMSMTRPRSPTHFMMHYFLVWDGLSSPSCSNQRNSCEFLY